MADVKRADDKTDASCSNGRTQMKEVPTDRTPSKASESQNGNDGHPKTSGVPHKTYESTDNEAPTEEANIADLIPQPPDGGWGWVIVMASFINHFIIDGIGYAFGTMLADYSEYFHSSAATTGALMSTLIGCYLLSAPAASALVNKYGCRIVGMIGAVIATTAFIISSFSESIGVLIFTLGVCGGIGFGLMYLPAVVSVSIYFEKKRAIAIGIATCGTGFGTFTFGPVGKWLMSEMDWKSVHIILASVILQGTVAYALVFPLASPRKKNRLSKQKKEKNPDESGAALMPNQNPLGSIKLHRSTAFIGSVNKVPTSTMLTVEQAEDLKRPMYKKDVFYSGSIYNLQEYKDVQNIQNYVASIVSIPAMQETKPKKSRILRCKCLPDQMADVLSEMLNVGLFKSLSFNIIFLSILILTAAYFIPFAYCAPLAVSLGVDAGKASFIVSILGISTMLGRLGACIIAQIPRLRALTIHNMFLFGAGISCIVIPVCNGYTTIAIAAFGYGFCVGAHVALSPIVLVDILGLNQLTTSFGLMTLARGISTLAGPVLGGYLFDKTSSYNSGFYMAGILVFISALSFCLLEIPCIRRREHNSG